MEEMYEQEDVFFAEYFTASGKLSFFMYSKEEFVKAINEDYKRE